MKHFTVFLREKLTEADLYLQELVLRKSVEIRSGLILLSQVCRGSRLIRLRTLGEAFPFTMEALKAKSLEELTLEVIE